MNKKKLLLIMPSLGSGGAEKSFVSLLGLLPRDNFDIYIMIINEGGLFYSLLPDDITIVESPRQLKIALGSIHSQFIKRECSVKEKFCKLISNVLVRFQKFTNLDLLQFTWLLWKKLIPNLSNDWDIAVSFMNGITNYFVIDKIIAKRKLLWVHNDYTMLKCSHEFDNKYFEKADKVITISDVCVQSLEKCFPKLIGKFVCIENISSAKLIIKMDDEAVPKEFQQIDDNTLKLLSIGRLVYQKGFDMAIEAAKIMRDEGLNFKWFIIGKGVLRSELQALINKNELDSHVILLGERANPYIYIKYCSLFIQTSRFEGKSIVLDEAKILNKPIVVTNYPSVADNIENGLSGIICNMTPNSIANAIEILSKDKKKQEDIISYLKKNCNGNEYEINKYIELLYD